MLRSLLDTGAATFDGEFHHVAVDSLGVRPAQARVPFLLGGHGRRVVALAARHADIFQFTGLTHGEDGVPAPGGFALDDVRQRARWLEDAAGDRDIERSALVQVVHVGAGADEAIAGLVDRFGTERGRSWPRRRSCSSAPSTRSSTRSSACAPSSASRTS